MKKSSLTKILIDWQQGLFHDINLKNNGAILILWFSTICGFGDIHEKFTDFSQQQNTTKKIIKAPTHLYESISASTLGLKYAFLTDVAKMPSS